MCSVCGCRDKAKAKPGPAAGGKESYECKDCGKSSSQPGSCCGKPMVKKTGGK